MSNRRPLETIRGAFKSGQRAENDRVHHCVILITQFRNPYAPDLLAAYGLWGSRMRQSELVLRYTKFESKAGRRASIRLYRGLFITANARRLLAGDKVCSGPLGTARDGSGRPGTARDGSGPLGMLGMKRVKPKLLMKNH